MEWMYAKGIPIEAQYLYRKGLEISANGQPERALIYLKQAVFLSPQYAKAIFEMGNCLAQLGRYDEAREKYRRAARIDSLLAGKMPAADGPVIRGQVLSPNSENQVFCSTF